MKAIEITAIETKTNKAGAYISATITGLDLDSLRTIDEEAKETKFKFDQKMFLNLFHCASSVRSKKLRKDAKTLQQSMDQAVKDNATIWIY